MDFLPALLRSEVTFLLSIILGVLLHEAGHAVAGRLAGLRPYVLTLGSGPILARMQLAGMWLVFRLLPLSGSVLRYHLMASQRLAGAACAAAGPAVNLLLAGVLYGALPFRFLTYDDWWVMIYGQLIIAVSSLLPYRYRRAGVMRRSDGYQVLHLLRGRGVSEAEQAYAALSTLVVAAGTRLPKQTPAGLILMFHAVRPDRVRDDWAALDSFLSTRMLLETYELNFVEQWLARDLLAGLALLYPNCHATLDELDEWTRDAAAGNAIPIRRLGRANVLSRLGRPAEALALIEGTPPPSGPPEAALVAMARANAMAAQGNLAEAKALLHQARRGANTMLRTLLRRAEARLPAGAPQP